MTRDMDGDTIISDMSFYHLVTHYGDGRLPLLFRQSKYPLFKTVLLEINLRLLFVFPGCKTTMSIIILFKNCIVNPVWCIDVWLGSVKPSYDWLCVQVDHLNSAHFAWSVYGENHPPLSHLAGIVILLKPGQAKTPQYPESLSHGPVAVWSVLIHQHHPLQHLPSSTTHEKE